MPITIKRVKVNLSSRKLRKKHETKVMKNLLLNRADARYFVRFQCISVKKKIPLDNRILKMLEPLGHKLFLEKLSGNRPKIKHHGQQLYWYPTEFPNPPATSTLH